MSAGRLPYGIVAEFADAEALLAAAQAARRADLGSLEAFSPFPVEGLDEALGLKTPLVPLLAVIGGLFAGVGFFLLQTWATVWNYPFDIGGRPMFSWPSYILPAFATAIGGAGLSAVFGMLVLNGLPRLHHPIFEHEGFARATQDRFFLRIGPHRGRFDREAIEAFLAERHALSSRLLP